MRSSSRVHRLSSNSKMGLVVVALAATSPLACASADNAGLDTRGAPSGSVGAVVTSPAESPSAVAALAQSTAAPHAMPPPPVGGDMHTMSGDVSPEAQKLFETGGKIAGAFTGVLGAIDTLKSLASLVGGGDSPTLESQMAMQFAAVNQKLDALLNEIGGVSFQISYAQIAPPLARLRAEAEDARAAVIATGRPYVPSVPGLVTLSKADVYTVMDDSVFMRTYATRLTDGEWKAAIGEPAVEVVDFRTWDWRVGLPALIEAISYRLIILAAVDPAFRTNAAYAPELTLYRDTLAQILSKIEGGIVCGFGVTAKTTPRSSYALCDPAMGPARGSNGMCEYDVTYQLDAYCADRFTGAYTKLSASSPLSADAVYDTTSCSSMGYGGPSGTCFPRDIGVNQHDTLSSIWNFTHLGVYSVDLLERFWSLAPTHPAFSDLIAFGLDDARAQLKIKLGLFGVRRAIDSLSMMVTHDQGPLAGGQLRSGYTNRCLSAAGDDASMGSAAVIAECDRASARDAETFSYDSVTGQLKSARWGTCLDVQNGSSRIQTPVWFWGCWPSVTDPRSNAQRWSYDPVSHRMRNALGRTLDITWGNTTPGNSVLDVRREPVAGARVGVFAVLVDRSLALAATEAARSSTRAHAGTRVRAVSAR